METCTVETGLLKKKPCGQTSVTHCVTCEQALCSKHAIAQLKENGLKSGKFMCKECDDARKAFEKNLPKPAEAKAAAAHAGAAHTAAKPATAPAAKPAAPAAAGAKPGAAPAVKPAAKPEEKKHDDSGPLEFTPSKPKPPADKK